VKRRLPSGGAFAEMAIGYVHIDHCELRLAEGRLLIFLAIDRASKFTQVAFFSRVPEKGRDCVP